MHKLRNATFIIPSTRERVKRQITIRNTAGFDGPANPNTNYEDSEDSFIHFERRLSSAGNLNTAIHNSRVSLKKIWRWVKSETGRNILKCSLAYLIASMGTFVPFLSNF